MTLEDEKEATIMYSDWIDFRDLWRLRTDYWGNS